MPKVTQQVRELQNQDQKPGNVAVLHKLARNQLTQRLRQGERRQEREEWQASEGPG